MMKNSFFSILVKQPFLVAFLIISNVAQSQWKEQTTGGSVGYQNAVRYNATGDLYTVLQDASNGYKVTVQKQNGTSWSIIGTAGFSTYMVYEPTMAVNQANGDLYVAYIESVSGVYKLSCNKFNGTSWVDVGAPEFLTTGGTGNPGMTINSSGNPVIVTPTSTTTFQVFQYNGSSWDNLTSGAVSNYNSLTPLDMVYTWGDRGPDPKNNYFPYADSNGDIYVAVSSAALSSPGIYVFKYSAGTWTQVGATLAGGSAATYQRVTKSPEGTLYVAYSQTSNANSICKIYVYKWSGSSWIDLSNSGTGIYNNTTNNNFNGFSFDIAFNSNSVPYVLYQNTGNDWRAYVKKYNSSTSNWDIARSGQVGGFFMDAGMRLFVDNAGLPYYVGTSSSSEPRVYVVEDKPVFNTTSFLPSSGIVGSTVNLYGGNFTGTTNVSFNGTSATFTVNSNTSITATVPANATTGTISVTNAAGTSTTSSNYTVVIPPPTITSFSPSSGSVGTAVTITGTGFDTTSANNTVYFDGVQATVTSASTTQLVVTFPAGTTGFSDLSVINKVNKLAVVSTKKFYSTFSNAGFSNYLTNSFASKVDFTAVSNTFSTTPVSWAGGLKTLNQYADFNLDGKPDYVQVGSASTSINPNTSFPGSISFGTQVVLSTGGHGVQTGDIDNDGLLDLIVYNSATINVFKNTSTINGTISFASPIALSVTNSAYRVYLKDMNNDGLLDLITANGTNIVYLLNNTLAGSTISFNTGSPVTVTSQATITDFAVVDLDNNNQLDFIAIHPSYYSLRFNTNAFSALNSAVTNFNIVAGDFDKDGDFDFVTYKDAYSYNVYQNSGSNSFTVNTISMTSSSGLRAALFAAEMNGNALPEFLGCEFNASDYIQIANNTSTSNLSFANTDNFSPLTAANNLSVTAYDVDGDGRPDLTSLQQNSATFSINRNIIGLPVISSFTPTSGNTGTTITVTGTALTGATAVTINGNPVTSFTVVSDTSITAVVPSGSTGPVRVTTPGGTNVSSTNFTYNPTITTTGTLTTFSKCSGSVSSSQTFTVSGANLTANLVVNAYSGLEYSLDNSTYTSTISIAPTSGTVASTSIYVRMTSASTSLTSGSISLTSTGATTKTVSVSGTLNSVTAISAHPSTTAQSVCQGTAFTALSVTASGTSLTYQWYSNTTASTTGSTLITGATSASYTPVNSTPSELYYYCVVTGTCGTVTSNISALRTVSATPVAGLASAASSTVCSGNTTILSLTGHTGAIQWQQSSTINGTYTTISGATSASYTTPALTATTYYRAVVTSGVCSSVNSNVVTISTFALATVPAITGNNALCVGSTTTLSNTQSGGTWSSLTPAVATIDTNGLVNALSAGTSVISYTIVDGNNCSASANISVNVANIPVAPSTLSALPTTVCSGSSVNLNATTTASGVNWYTTATGGTPIGSSLSGENFSVTAASNTPIYYAESYNTIISGTQTINYTGTITTFTVPSGVTKMTIDTRGASGGNAGGRTGGNGARMVGEFTVIPGQVLKVLVGGTGSNGASAAGGGGGTFVTDNSNNPLCIAGGGGGAQSNAGVNGNPGLTTTSGGGWNGGTNGNGGGQSYSSGGGGLLTNGTASGYGGPGLSFLNGGAGGAGCGSAGAGGFGGGSGGEWCFVGSAGAGGGYSGGGGNNGAGNGGGSFNNGTNQSNTQGFNSGNGSVVFSWNIGSCTSTSRTQLPITVNESIAGTAAAASSTICTGTTASLTLTGSTGTIQWQSSTNNSTWTNISGATAATFTTPTLTSTTYYRAVVTSGSCASVNSNVVTITITTNQPFANALALNGTGKIQFGNQAQTAVGSNFTVEAWVNIPSSVSNIQTIISNSSGIGQSGGFRFGINTWNTNDGKLVFEGGSVFVGSSVAIAKNVWQHVAVVVNGSTIAFYINGNLAGTATGSFPVLSSSVLTLGAFSDGQYPFNGMMDEVRLWNTPKTQQEILASMYSPLAGTESSLVAYFNFNQGVPGGTNTTITNLNDNGPSALTASLSEITLTGTAENFVGNTNPMAVTGSLACVGSTVQLNHPQSGGTWTSATTSVATVSSTGLVTCLTAGSSVITYAYTYNGCQFTNTYTVTVNATPTTPTVANTTISYCQNGSATALSATAAASHSLRWYTVATGGTGSATAITPVTSTAGTFTYYVSQANASGCEGPRVAITVTVSPVSVAGTASVNLASVCGGSTVDLSLTGNTGTIQWQSSPNNSTWTNISGATAATYTTTALNATTYFRAVVTSGACSAANSNVLTVTVTTIAVPTTTTSITECQGNTATQLSATALSGHTLQWYTVSTGGTASSTAITPDLSNAAVTTYYVSQLNNTSNCESARVPINVTVYALPAAPTATTTINYCQGATATALAATATSGYSLQWYTASTGGTASSTAPTPTTSSVGNTTYYVSQKQPSGTYNINSAYNWSNYFYGANQGQTFQVANNVVLSNISINLMYCDYNTTAVMKIYNGVGGSLIATSNNTINVPSTHNYDVVFSFANQNIQLAQGQTYYFQIISPQSYYLWGNNNEYANGAAFVNGTISAKDIGFNLSSTLIVNPCESPRTAITVNVNAVPTITGAQSMTVGGSTLQLTGSGTPNANSPWTSSSTSTATISATGEVTAVAGGSTIITYTNADGCSISQSITVVDCSQPLGNVLHFDGVNDYITTASNIPALNITADLTLETWIKFDQVNSDYVRLIGKGDANNRTYGLWLQTDGKLLFQINGTPTGLNFTSTTSLQPGIWYHIAAIRNGNTAKIFINGVEDATATTTVSPQTNTFPLTVGYGTIHNYLKGSLEDVRVWNIARSVSQIQQGMYNSIAGNETGLVAYYDFNQGIASGNNTTITTANDKSLNALNATLTNFGKTGVTSNFIGNTIVNFAVSGASIVCANSTSQFTHPRSGGTWSISNGASASINSSGLLTTLANENVTVSYTYSINGCSVTDSKSVSINTPAAPVVTTPVNLCQGVTATALTATPVSGSNLLWYTAATGGTASSTAPTPTTTTVGSTTYYVSQKAPSGPYIIDNLYNYNYANNISTFGQTFTPANNIILNSITLKTAYINTNTPNIVLKIYNGYGGALLATANSPFTSSYGYTWFNDLGFSFSGQNLVLTSGQTYYLEFVPNSTMYPGYSNAYANGTGYINGSVISQDFAFKLDASINSNPCESPRTAIVVNVNAIPTITGAQNMTVGGSTLQLTGSGTPNANSPWTSSNTAVAIISATGEVTAVAGGSTTITYTNSDGCSISQSITVVDCAQPFGNALSFGVGTMVSNADFVEVNSRIFPSQTVANFTIETWIKPSASDIVSGTPGGSWFGFLGSQNSQRNPSMWITNSGALHASWWDNGYGGTPVSASTPSSLIADKWTHVALVKDGTTMRIYANGIQVNSAACSPTITVPNNNYWFGKVDNQFNGSLDEVRFWSTARTQAQIAASMYTELVGNEAGLLANFDFNQGIANGNNTAITTVINKANSALNGTLTNFTKTGTSSNFVANSITSYPITGAAIVCANSTAQYTHPVSGGTWTISNGANATISNSGLLTTAANENVTVSYTYTINGCSKTATLQVTIETPAAPVATTAVNLCQGITASALSATALTGNTLQWYTVATGGTASLTAPNPSIASLGVTMYYVSQKNNTTTCESPRTAITVTVNAIPTITGVQNMTLGGSTLQLTGSGTPDATTPWSSTNTAVATISSTGEVTAVAGGTSVITYTTASGCSITTTVKVTDCAAPFGNALNFDGVNDYAIVDNVGNNSNLSFAGTANFSIEAWVKRENTNGIAMIFSKYNGNVAGNYWLGIDSTGKPILSREASPWGVTATNTMPVNEWHHIAATYDGSQTRIYVDGVLNNTTSAPLSINQNVSAIKVNIGAGLANNSPAYLFKGELDEIRVWNIARTPTQIQQAYKSALQGNEAGLVAYYDFNQGLPGGDNSAISSVVNTVNSVSNGTLTNFTKTGTISNFVGSSIANLAIAGLETVCANSTSQFTHPISGGTWSVSNGANSTINASGLLTTLGAESVTISYLYTINGCSFTATKTVAIVVTSLSAQPSTTAQNVCINGVTASISVTATGSGITYQWYRNTNATNTGGTLISGATNSVFMPSNILVGTTYYYCVVSSTCSSPITSSVSGAITISPASVAGTINGTASVCLGSTTTLTLSGNVGTIQWQVLDSTVWTDIAGATSTTFTTPALTQNTTYRVVVTSGVCSAVTSANVNVVVNSLPVISGTTSVGAGESITLTATTTAASSNAWVSSTPAVASVSNTGVINGLMTGTTTITFTNNNGCSDTETITVVAGITQTPVLTLPATNTLGATTLNFNYSLPETPLAGSVTMTFTPTSGGTPIVWAMNNATSATFSYVVGTNPASISNVVSGVALGFTTYNVTLAYQDAFANPASNTTNTNIQTLAPPSISFANTNYNGVINQPISIQTVNSGGGMVTYSIAPTLPTGLTLNTATGLISGTPTVSLTQTSFTVTATNAAGADSESFNLFIDADTDGDGIGDVNDPDIDGDGILNGLDICPYTVNTSLVSQPNAQTVNLCLSAIPPTLTVVATGQQLTYQWYFNSSNSNTGGTAISGATSASYVPSTSTVTRFYYVVVSGTCGSAISNVSGAITISPTSVAGSIAGATTVCSGTNTTVLTLSGNTGTIQWQSSTDNITFTNIVSATTSTYTAINLTVTTYYRAVVTSGVCSSATTTASSVTVSPTSVAGNIAGATTVCSGTNATVLTLSGNIGAIQWQSSIDNVTFTNIASATASTYTATNITATTYYRAVVTSGVCAPATTTAVTITVSPTSLPGSIAGATSVCSGTNSTVLTLSGNIGTIQWQWSTDNVTFFNIPSATTLTHTATNITTTTYYRAVITSGVCSSATTNVSMIAVNPTSVAGSIAGATTVCSGTNSTVLTLSGNTGTIQWQSSIDNVTFTNITGATASTYTATNITATTYYRAVVSSGVCSPATTTSVTITVNPTSVAGSIAGATTVCSGTNSTLLTLSGNIGTIQWQSSTNNVTFTNITGATASTYTATNITTTTYYRAVITSGVCPSAITAAVSISVSPTSVAGNISGATTVCSGTNSTVLTLSGNTGTIQWQSSIDNVTFTNITGATASTYTATNITATTYYRAVVSSGVCSPATTTSVTITVNPTSVAGSIAGATTVCSGTNSTLLTLSGNIGTIQWQSSTNNVTFTNITGATASTYTATNISATTYYRVVVTSGVCPSASSVAVTITYIPIVAPTAVSNQQYCYLNNPTVSSLVTTSGVGIKWYASATGGTPLTGSTPLTTATTYYASQTISVCESPTRVAVTVLLTCPVDAIADNFGLINGYAGATTASVLSNDTINGGILLPSQIILTGITVPTGLTLNANGTITIAPQTATGTYNITYRICEVLNPTNCDNVTFSIIVGACLDFAINDCDLDGESNGTETANGTNPSDACSYTNPPASSSTVYPTWSVLDCDGDGVINGQEITDGTSPTNPCSSNPINITVPLSASFLNGDCDSDGLLNGEEMGSNVNYPNDSNGNGIPDYLEVNNHTVSEDNLEVYSSLTPNGDGNNDLFIIRNIENYPENNVSIYNRWGIVVYDVDGYGQDNKYFKGVSEGRITINSQDELPIGTYFYIIKYKNNNGEQKQRSGYLYINR